MGVSLSVLLEIKLILLLGRSSVVFHYVPLN